MHIFLIGDDVENIFYYLKWRGDITFKESSFNEVDNLIFCALAYLKFDNFLQKDDIWSLTKTYEYYLNNKVEGSNFYQNSEKLLALVSQTKRFKDVKISKYKRINNEYSEKQFGAMTFILPNNCYFVAFSGTDDTIIGWKEDFNMSFLNVLPAQEEAKNYLEEICQNVDNTILVGGHSKGGNLAMYAAIFCKDIYKSKILKVYNNDGPGLPEKVFTTSKFLQIKNKITTYIPKFSIVGYLFYNKTNVKFIKSYNLGFLEHDLFSWKVIGNHFEGLSNVDSLTKKLIEDLNKDIENIPKDKRQKIINTIFAILDAFNIKTLADFKTVIPDTIKFLKENNFSQNDYLEFINIMEKVVKIITKLNL